jgi:hypothetical protein
MRLFKKTSDTDSNPKIEYSILNNGEVPAVIRLIYAEALVVETLNPPAIYKQAKFKYTQQPIAGGKMVPGQPVFFDTQLTQQDYADAETGTKMIVLKTLLTYTGPLNFTYLTGITYMIKPSTGENWAVGGDAYNYEKTEKGRLQMIGLPQGITIVVP